MILKQLINRLSPLTETLFDFSKQRLWILIGLFILWAVTTINILQLFYQKDQLQQSQYLAAELGYALNDVHTGVLNLALDSDDEQAWDATKGIKLLEQAMASFHRVETLLPLSMKSNDFQNKLTQLLSQLNTSFPEAESIDRTSLRLNIYQLNVIARQLGNHIRDELNASNSNADFRRSLVIITSILLLLLAVYCFYRGIREDLLQKSIERSSRDSEIRLKNILESAPDPIVVTDNNANIIIVNKLAEQIFEYNRQELIGQPIEILVPRRYGDSHVKMRDAYFENPVVRPLEAKTENELYARAKDGREFPVEISLSPIETPQGKIIASSIRDISARKKIEYALEEERLQLKIVMDSSPIAVGILKGGIFHYVNNRMTQMIGVTESDSFKSLFLKPEEAVDLKDRLDRDLILSNYETEVITQDGRTLYVIANFLRRVYHNENTTLCWFFDISSQKQIQSEMEAAKLKAELATKTKSEFLANMSHEIRTPMNAIIGMTYLTLNTPLSSKQQKYVNSINIAAKSLLTILDDILDFSKIEANKMTLEKSAFSLNQLFSNVISQVAFIAQEKRLELVINYPLDIPDAFIGDPTRVSQILLNILNNAVKFTEQGEVIFGCDVIDRTDEQVILEFTVRDTGIGMTEAQLSKLFESFSQADTSMTRKYGGTGLGLTISKRLSNMMGGDINVKSESGVGSEFKIKLPLMLGNKKSIKEFLSADTNRLFHNKHVLIVDDNSNSAQALAEMLTHLGVQPRIAETGQKGLELLEVSTPDFIFVDWFMPEMSGVEFCRRAIETENICAEQLILMTPIQDAELQSVANDIGISISINKPVTLSVLVDTFANNHSKNNNSMKLNEKQKVVQTEYRSLENKQILVVEDNEINMELIEELLLHAGAVVHKAFDGQQAIDILKEQDFDAVLMDCQMPVLNGYEATRIIRNELMFNDLPIIALTANTMSGDRQIAIDAGMNDHIGKPIDVDLLFKTLSNWVGQGVVKKQVVPHRPVNTSLVADKFTHIDINRGLTITANNTELLERLLLKFADTYQSVLSKLQILLADNNNQQIENLAHSLKGASASIGALELQSLSAELELNAKKSNANEISRLISMVGKSSDNVIAEIKKVVVNGQKMVISSPKENSTTAKTLLVENVTITKHLKLLKKYIQSNDTSAEHEAMRLIAANMVSKDKQPLMDMLLNQIRIYDFEAAEKTFMNLFDDYLGTEL